MITYYGIIPEHNQTRSQHTLAFSHPPGTPYERRWKEELGQFIYTLCTARTPLLGLAATEVFSRPEATLPPTATHRTLSVTRRHTRSLMHEVEGNLSGDGIGCLPMYFGWRMARDRRGDQVGRGGNGPTQEAGELVLPSLAAIFLSVQSEPATGTSTDQTLLARQSCLTLLSQQAVLPRNCLSLPLWRSYQPRDRTAGERTATSAKRIQPSSESVPLHSCPCLRTPPVSKLNRKEPSFTPRILVHITHSRITRETRSIIFSFLHGRRGVLSAPLKHPPLIRRLRVRSPGPVAAHYELPSPCA